MGVTTSNLYTFKRSRATSGTQNFYTITLHMKSYLSVVYAHSSLDPTRVHNKATLSTSYKRITYH